MEQFIINNLIYFLQNYPTIILIPTYLQLQGQANCIYRTLSFYHLILIISNWIKQVFLYYSNDMVSFFILQIIINFQF